MVSYLTARHGLEVNSNGDLKLATQPYQASSEISTPVTDVDVLNDSDMVRDFYFIPFTLGANCQTYDMVVKKTLVRLLQTIHGTLYMLNEMFYEI